jgi:hypothetical protein
MMSGFLNQQAEGDVSPGGGTGSSFWNGIVKFKTRVLSSKDSVTPVPVSRLDVRVTMDGWEVVVSEDDLTDGLFEVVVAELFVFPLEN